MKQLLIHIICSAALVFSGTGIAAATTVFNFAGSGTSSGNPYGNSLSMSVGGVSVTETAWYTANTSSGTSFQTAALDNYSGYGLGICSSPEGVNCGSPYHQIDNNSGVEFVDFQFSTPVSLSSIQLYVYQAIGSDGGNANITYYSASTELTTSTTLGSLGSGTNVNASCSGSACVGTSINENISGNNVKNLIVAASVPDATSGLKIDDFKLSSITLAVATPEPASFGMFAMALTIFGLATWRRRFAKPAPALCKNL